MTVMTPRERFLETLLFGKPDRVPRTGICRESTRRAWYAQGLPKDAGDIAEYAYRMAGGKLPWPQGGPGFPINERMIPQFEEKVIERRANSQVVQDWKGEHLRDRPGVQHRLPALGHRLRHPLLDQVSGRVRSDWEEMRSATILRTRAGCPPMRPRWRPR